MVSNRLTAIPVTIWVYGEWDDASDEERVRCDSVEVEGEEIKPIDGDGEDAVKAWPVYIRGGLAILVAEVSPWKES